jgi:hypothetical protein
LPERSRCHDPDVVVPQIYERIASLTSCGQKAALPTWSLRTVR